MADLLKTLTENLQKKKRRVAQAKEIQIQEEELLERINNTKNVIEQQQTVLRDLQKKMEDLGSNPRRLSGEEINRLETSIENMTNSFRKARISANQTFSSSRELECVVCFDVPGMNQHIFSCSKGHLICQECLSKLDEENNRCPYCRENFDAKPPERNALAERLLSQEMN